MTETLLDEENGKEALNKKAFMDAEQKKYLKRLLIFTGINVIIYFSLRLFISKSADLISIRDSALSLGLGLPIAGTVLSLFLNFIPYKNFSYSERYLRTTCLTIFIFELIMSVILAIALFFTLSTTITNL